MFARIFRPAKTAMQSGKAKAGEWMLEFEPAAARRIDPLMGWTSSADTVASQVRLTFETLDAAIAYAEREHIPYQVIEPQQERPVPKAYSDNFSYRRRKPWTH